MDRDCLKGHSPGSHGSRRGVWVLGVLAAALLAVGGGAVAFSGTPSSSIRPAGACGDVLLEAKRAFSDRNYIEAERLLRELIQANPQSWEVKALLGRTLLERGRLNAAREIFTALLKADPKDVQAMRGLGATYRGMGQMDLATLYFTRATELDPKNPQLWKDLGLCQKEKGDALGALSSLQQSISLDREQADLTQLLSELATGRLSPAAAPPGLSRAGLPDPLNPRPIDPASLVPTPRAPDPTQHFPKPAGRSR